MTKDPIVLVMSNPTPEIMPDLAKEAGAAVVGTGRSDFPNQVNNVIHSQVYSEAHWMRERQKSPKR